MSLNKPCLQSPACNILREVSGLTSSCSEFLSKSPLLAQEQGASLGCTFAAPIAAQGPNSKGIYETWRPEPRGKYWVIGEVASRSQLGCLSRLQPPLERQLQPCHLPHANSCPASFIKSQKSPVFERGALPRDLGLISVGLGPV